MSVNLSTSSIKYPEENESRAKGLYQFYWALRGRDLPKIELEGLKSHEIILRIEEWLNSTDFSKFTCLSMVKQGWLYS